MYAHIDEGPELADRADTDERGDPEECPHPDGPAVSRVLELGEFGEWTRRNAIDSAREPGSCEDIDPDPAPATRGP